MPAILNLTTGVVYLSPTAVLPATQLSLAGQTIGDLLYADSTTTFTRLADVAAGQVLASGGAGAAPAYTATPTVTSINATSALQINSALAVSVTAPTVSAGFGSTSPGTVTYNTGTLAVVVTVGTNAGGTTGTLTFPSAPHGWAVVLQDVTNTADLTRQTGYTQTTAAFSTTVAWTTGDVLVGIAVPF